MDCVSSGQVHVVMIIWLISYYVFTFATEISCCSQAGLDLYFKIDQRWGKGKVSVRAHLQDASHLGKKNTKVLQSEHGTFLLKQLKLSFLIVIITCK